MMTPPPSGCNLCSGVRVYRFLPCRLHVSMHFSKADNKEIKEKRKGRVRQRGGKVLALVRTFKSCSRMVKAW